MSKKSTPPSPSSTPPTAAPPSAVKTPPSKCHKRVFERLSMPVSAHSQDHDDVLQTSPHPYHAESRKDGAISSLDDWLQSHDDDVRISQLQCLVHYVRALVADAGSDAEVTASAVQHALGGITTELQGDLSDSSQIRPVLFFAYLTCFKLLIYLEAHAIPFDVAFVLDVVRWKDAYEAIAHLCLAYVLNHCDVDPSDLHDYSFHNSKYIDHDAASFLLHDLKKIAKADGDWKMSFKPRSDKLYGPKLQPSPTITMAQEVLVHGNAPWHVLDNREPNGFADDVQETITLIMTYVSAVDRMFGVTRSSGEWHSLRDLLTQLRVSDADGDVHIYNSTLSSNETYGVYRSSLSDSWTPIGIRDSSMVCDWISSPGTANRFWNPEPAEENNVASFEHLDPYTIKLVRKDGTEQLFAFICDVRYLRVTEDVSHVRIDGSHIYFNYACKPVISTTDEDWLDAVTNAIQTKVFHHEDIVAPYPFTKGMEAVAYGLIRPWGEWRGVDVVDGTVAIAVFTSLLEYLEGPKTARGERKPTKWDGLYVDAEVIAMCSTIETPPTSLILMAYMAHLFTCSKYKWPHQSSMLPMTIGSQDLIPLFDDDDVKQFVEFESQKSRDLLTWHGPVSEARGSLVIQGRFPWDLMAFSVSLFLLSLIPLMSVGRDGWIESLREVNTNLGTVFTPLFALYFYSFYCDQELAGMMRGNFICKSLGVASATVGSTKEAIATFVKHMGLSEEVFRTTGNSVSLRGYTGAGLTSSCGGLEATLLMDAGALFLAWDDGEETPRGMVDVGGFLHLSLDSTSKQWKADSGCMECRIWRVMKREELQDVVIS